MCQHLYYQLYCTDTAHRMDILCSLRHIGHIYAQHILRYICNLLHTEIVYLANNLFKRQDLYKPENSKILIEVLCKKRESIITYPSHPRESSLRQTPVDPRGSQSHGLHPYGSAGSVPAGRQYPSAQNSQLMPMVLCCRQGNWILYRIVIEIHVKIIFTTFAWFRFHFCM